MTHRRFEEVESLFNTSINPEGEVRKGGSNSSSIRLVPAIRLAVEEARRVEKDISGPGSPTDSSDVYTPAAGGDRKRKRPKEQDMLGVVGEELD